LNYTPTALGIQRSREITFGGVGTKSRLNNIALYEKYNRESEK
jgi:hypothetical protein